MSATGTALQAIEHQISHSYIEEFKQLVSHELPKFYRQAYRQLENPHDAEDAVQDAIVSAYKNLSQFKGRAKALNLVYGDCHKCSSDATTQKASTRIV